jgi:hypothetical protein
MLQTKSQLEELDQSQRFHYRGRLRQVAEEYLLGYPALPSTVHVVTPSAKPHSISTEVTSSRAPTLENVVEIGADHPLFYEFFIDETVTVLRHG